VVTGANKGIGLAIVRSLCHKYQGEVYLTSRDEARGRQAVKTLEQEGLQPRYHVLDICSHKSILQLRDFMVDQHGGIDILVNNAGILVDSSESLGLAAEVTLETNYWANKEVCDILFPILRAGGRVVNLSSAAGWLGHLTRGLPALNITGGDQGRAEQLLTTLSSPNLTVDQLDSLMRDFVRSAQAGEHHKHGWLDSAYFVSKIGWSALSRIQARQMETDTREDIVVNHVHPGFVDTDLNNHTRHLSIDRGAESSVMAALLPPKTKVRGEFIWHDCQVVDWVTGPLPHPGV